MALDIQSQPLRTRDFFKVHQLDGTDVDFREHAYNPANKLVRRVYQNGFAKYQAREMRLTLPLFSSTDGMDLG